MRLSNLLPFLVILVPLMAQTPEPSAGDPHAADRQALLKVFHQIEDSINSQSLAQMAAQMDPQAVVVWGNGEVSRGPKEALDYYDRMVKGKDRILEKYMTKAKLSGPARFLGNGDVAIADGTMEDEYFPIIRGSFKLDSKWTATVAKSNGEWKVVALHLSANVFNNVLLDEAKRALGLMAGGGLVVGMLVGWFVGRRTRQA
jgi:hypothetical protein